MIRLIPLILLSFCALAPAAVVRTLGGGTLEGEIKLDGGQITLFPRGANQVPVRVEVEDILSANFAGAGVLPSRVAPRWKAMDIGQVGPKGMATFGPAAITIKGSGGGLNGNEDSFYFVNQGMVGDGQVVAQVKTVGNTDRMAHAGVMLRASADPAAAYAMVVVYAGGNAAYQARVKPGAKVVNRITHGGPGGWVKLARKGNAVTGYYSADGKEWELIISETIALPKTALGGAVVCANNNAALCAAGFAELAVVSAAPAAPAADGVKMPPRGVVLRSGEVLAGDVGLVSASTVRLRREKEISIPLVEVSRILFNAIPRTVNAKIEPGRAGILRAGGDFYDGEMRKVEGGQVFVSSVLFGLQRFDVGGVLMAVLRDQTPRDSRYEVQLADGSLLHVDRIALDGSLFVIESQVAGTLRVGLKDLAEIKAAASRFVSLLSLKPVHAPAGLVLVDGGDGRPPLVLKGQTFERGMRLQAGTSVSYTIDGPYRALALRFGISDEGAAGAAASLVIIADGKEIYKSPARVAVDEPLAVSVDIQQVKTLELKVESDAPANPPVWGVIGEALLVK